MVTAAVGQGAGEGAGGRPGAGSRVRSAWQRNSAPALTGQEETCNFQSSREGKNRTTNT